MAGNKTQISKKRGILHSSEHVSEDICKNLKKENGVYSYRYDKLDRLAEVYKDGERLRRYEYDAFGNRIRKQEGRVSGIYKYNAANQLLEISGTGEKEKYEYDKRGNLIEIIKEGKRVHRYQYDAANRLSKAVNGKGQMACYDYCGLGYRIGKQEYMMGGSYNWGSTWEDIDYKNEKTTAQIDYMLDFTKSYHNLLAKTKTTDQEMNMQEYIWDSNVVSMTEGDESYVYLQDELGSPVRLLDMQGKVQTVYGYDEFGQDLFGNQGDMQPFGYTGYEKDGVANTYFAQAREYIPGLGRFDGEDLVKGMILRPKTLNRYQYCIDNPLNYMDANGLAPARVSNPSSALDTSKYLYYDEDITSREKAMKALRVYADKFGNENTNTTNPEYPYFSHGSGNCANFVSQCLYASGLDMTEDWYMEDKVAIPSRLIEKVYDHLSNTDSDPNSAIAMTGQKYFLTWTSARKQYEFFKDLKNGYIEGSVIRATSLEEYDAIVKSGLLEAGDLLYWDEDGDGQVNHATILTEVTTKNILFAGNTRRRFDKSVRKPFKDYLEKGSATLNFVRLKDSAFIAECPCAT